MLNNKKVIAILTDASFLCVDVAVPMNVIFEVIRGNCKDTYFVYGMNNRVDWHVEEYSRVFRVPKENLIKFNYEKDPNKRHLVSTEFLSLFQYGLDKVYLFRDNLNSPDSALFITKAISDGIDVITIDNSGKRTLLNKLSQHMNDTYYHTKSIGFKEE
jgi:hypothetical protein